VTQDQAFFRQGRSGHFYGVGELKRLLRSVAGGKARIAWRTTLFPRGWPRLQVSLPWGGFIGMTLIASDELWEI